MLVVASGYNVLDHDHVVSGFTRVLAEGDLRESLLLVHGIHCAACSGLIESVLRPHAGVREVSVNVASRLVRVVWDPALTCLSTVCEALDRVGYRPFPADSKTLAQAQQQFQRRMIWRLFVAGLGMMQVMMYSVPEYVAAQGDIAPDIVRLLHWASWVLSLPVLIFSAHPFFANAWRDLSHRRIGMDVPVSLGIILTFGWSSWSVLIGHGPVWFDSVTMFIFFLLGGRWLVQRMQSRALVHLDDLTRRLPVLVERVTSTGVESVVVAHLNVGDVVRVRVGDIFPADGEVLEGVSMVNESLLTGESVCVAKRVGDGVIAGACNESGLIVMRIDRLGDDTRLGQIVQMMAYAQAEKPRWAELADRLAPYFLTGVLVIAALSGWWWRADIDQALLVMVAVLVVTCPCALSLSTPLAMTMAMGVLAKQGVLLRHPQAIEALANIDTVVFDKTGTLTCINKYDVGINLCEGSAAFSEQQAFQLAASLEQTSLHPIAHAFGMEAMRRETTLLRVDNAHEVVGVGVEGTIEGVAYRLGQCHFVSDKSASTMSAQGMSIVLAYQSPVQNDAWIPIAEFTINNELHEDASDVVSSLHAMGIHIILLSGDDVVRADAVAQHLHIETCIAGATPANKLAVMADLQSQGRRVGMVGDGLNDGPVLSKADVSFAVANAAPLSQSYADFILLSDRLMSIVFAHRIAQRTLMLIRQNLIWSILYNMIAIPFAFLGFLTPGWASIGMLVSSLFVVLNVMRLLHDVREYALSR